MKPCSTFADMFLEHLDTQLDEEDVQKITSGTKTKNQITVVKSPSQSSASSWKSGLFP